MQQYKDLVKLILEKGYITQNRTGDETIGIFGHQMRFDLREGFPLLTLKKTRFTPIKRELLWFLRGETNTKTLGSKIWDAWADIDGDCGPIYGKQWRSWDTFRIIGNQPEYASVDQVKKAIYDINMCVRHGENNRGIIVSAWNVADLTDMALRPCHTMFQFHLRPAGSFLDRMPFAPAEANKRIADFPEADAHEILDDYNVPRYFLSCQLYQRSGDVGLGIPYNIASYSLLTAMIAQVTNTIPFEFIHTIGDAHIYESHIQGLIECIEREEFSSPRLVLNPAISDIDDFKEEDINLEGYEHHPEIKFKVAI